VRLADAVSAVAADVRATPAQVALAWLLARPVPLATIPGTRRIERLEENWAAQDVTLTPAQLQSLDALLEGGVQGTRY